MNGLLSTIFDDGQGDGGSADQQSDTIGTHAGQDLDLSPHVHVGAGGSHATPDGGTESWSQSDDIGAHVDFGAAVAATLGTTETLADSG